MEQAGSLFKLWTDQQQTCFARSPGCRTQPPRRAELARRRHERRPTPGAGAVAVVDGEMDGAGEAGPAPIGHDQRIVEAAVRPQQWAHGGLGPLDAAIEHLVDGPSYATLWTLDRKFLRAQKLRAEWSRDLAAYQMLMQGAWNEGVKRFLARSTMPRARRSPVGAN